MTLRLPELGDASTIQRACAHPSTRWGIHLLPRPYLLRHATRFVNQKRAAYRNRQSLALAITTDDHSLVGMIELSHFALTDRVAELGYWIVPRYRGNGYATEAARAMCDVGFRVLRLHRIEAGALARNRASIRVLEKAGLRREGVLRERARIGRNWIDGVLLARLATE